MSKTKYHTIALEITDHQLRSLAQHFVMRTGMQRRSVKRVHDKLERIAWRLLKDQK